MRAITSFLPTLLLASLVLAPSAVLRATDSVNLPADHAAAVDRQRRIFFQYDPAADIQRKGGFGSDMGAVMGYVFDTVCQPGSQLDAICIDVSNESVAHYRSKILPAIQHPGLMQWREQGVDDFAISVNRKGPFPPSTYVKVETVEIEMHLK